MGEPTNSANANGISDELTRRSVKACEGLARAMANARKAAGVSKTDMAEKLGVTRETIRQYEKNGTKIPAYAVIQYSRALQVPLEDLFKGTGVYHPPEEAEQPEEEEDPLAYLELLDEKSKKYILEIVEALPDLPMRMIITIAAEISAYTENPRP